MSTPAPKPTAARHHPTPDAAAAGLTPSQVHAVLAAQSHVLSLLAADDPLEDVLTAVVKLLEDGLPGARVGVHTLQNQALLHCVGPSLPPAVTIATREVPASLAGGPYGMAVVTQTVVVVEDADNDPMVEPWRPALRQAGVRSLWVTPVLASHGPVGVVAVYGPQPHAPAAHEHALLAQASLLARLAVERRRHADALQQRELLFRTLVETTQEIVFSVDQAGVFTFVSSNWTRQLGHPLATVVNQPMDTWVHPEDRALLTATREAVFARGQASQLLEYRTLHEDQTWCWMAVTLHPVKDAQGRVVSAVGTARDITQHKDLQAQLTLTERLAGLGTLAAGVAHEINNPLSYVLGNLTYIVGALATARSGGVALVDLQDMHAAAEDAVEGSRRVAAIVQELRTFSRDDGGSQGSCNLSGVVDVALGLVSTTLRHQARLTVEVPPNVLVRGSEARLSQVLVNLLLNAQQALPDRAASLNQVSVRAVSKTHGVELTVVDNGVGIPRDLLARVFDPFFTTRPVGVGTGLGLSICHGIVTSVGGTMGVASEAQQGTTVTVTLRHAAALPAAPGDAPTAPRHVTRVLVVDDEPAVGRAVGRSLRPEMDVVWVTTGRQALELLQAGHTFDAVLCDGVIPGTDVGQLHSALGARVGLLTGATSGPHGQALPPGFKGPVLHKPFDAHSIRAFVEKLLAQGT